MYFPDDTCVPLVPKTFCATSDKSREGFDILELCGSQRRNAAISKVSLVVKGPGISKIARLFNLL